jgi:hypothetical protein
MAKKKKKKQHYKMPKAIWQIDSNELNFQQKTFLAFIWWCAPNGCHCWNCRLEKRFKKSKRTIQYWITHLVEMELIAVGLRNGSGRTIWPRYKHPPRLLKKGDPPGQAAKHIKPIPKITRTGSIFDP